MSDECCTQRAAPLEGLHHDRFELSARGCIESLERVDRTENLLERAPIGVEFEFDLVALAPQTVDAPRHSVTIDLESMAQTRLGNSFTSLHLHQESMHVGHDVVVDFGNVPRHDRTDQEPTEAGSRLARQHHVPK